MQYLRRVLCVVIQLFLISISLLMQQQQLLSYAFDSTFDFLLVYPVVIDFHLEQGC